jgi:alkanesulfonate monooxygenase SsuD/methylene tetrahydromethanopterin reductase-like flavin-dependent oxidoreductase (luciferase family)
VLRLLFDPAVERADFSGKYFQLVNAPNNPKPLQPRVRIWIGGGGEKRTLQSVARYADGWNAPYLDPGKWKAKSRVLDEWCEKIGRDPRTIIRTVNVGFYIGADAKGARRGEALWQRHWGSDPQGRRGFFRGTPKEAIELAAAYRDAGAARVNIALRQGPYDWDALEAFAAEVVPALDGR